MLLVFLIVLNTCSSDESTSIAVLETLPSAPAPDADSPADTIKTLTATVAKLHVDVQALRNDNRELHDDNQLLLARARRMEMDLQGQVKTELDKSLDTYLRESRAQTRALEDLEQRMNTMAQESSRSLPVRGATESGVPPSAAGYTGSLVWVEPLTSTNPATGASGYRVEPSYTIPKNSSLFNATTITALVGRVPLADQVRDPMPFSIVIGPDNLTANGHEIPEIQGMVWSGVAIGDWTLSCVTGSLTSATFIYPDGTIRTIDAQSEQNRLGWIADEHGVPCLTGKRISNASSWLAAQVAAGAIAGAADAAAVVEVERRANLFDNVSTIVSGDARKYIGGKATASASEALSSYLNQRSNQEFDAIFVPPGQTVLIQVAQEIHIDYQREGRKLAYSSNRSVLDTDTH